MVRRSAILIGLAALAALALFTSTAVAAKAVLDKDPNQLRFGAVPAVGATSFLDVTITNTSQGTVSPGFYQLIAGAGFFVDTGVASTCRTSGTGNDGTTTSLAPGASCVFRVGFDPLDTATGRQTRELSMLTSEAGFTNVKLSGRAVAP